MAQRFKIMTVDDDPGILLLLSKILKKEGYEVISYNNAIDALERLETEHIDIIFSDIMMPYMSGIQFCAKVKEKHKSIYFILLTAKDTVEDLAEGLEIGANDYITKPFSNIEVFARVNAGKRIVETFNNYSRLNKKYESIINNIQQIYDISNNVDGNNNESYQKALTEIKNLANKSIKEESN